MGRRFGNPAGVTSVTCTSFRDDAARQPSSAAVRQPASRESSSTCPATEGVSEEVAGALSPIVVFPVVVLAAFTGVDRSFSLSSAGPLVPGVDTVDAADEPDARRRVRNQTDSSSLKIGSSMVWSATGTVGCCGGVYGCGAGGVAGAAGVGRTPSPGGGVEELGATGGQVGGAAGLGTSADAGGGAVGRAEGAGTCGCAAVTASAPNPAVPSGRCRGMADWSCPLAPAAIRDSPGRRCGKGGTVAGGDGGVGAGGGGLAGGCWLGGVVPDGAEPAVVSHDGGEGHGGLLGDRSVPLRPEGAAPVKSDQAGRERPSPRAAGDSPCGEVASGPASNSAGEGCGRSGGAEGRLSNAKGVGRCGSLGGE